MISKDSTAPLKTLLTRKFHVSQKNFDKQQLTTAKQHGCENTNLTNLLGNLPLLASWKNERSIFLGHTKQLAHLISYEKAQSLIGQSYSEVFPWATMQSMNIPKQEDQLVMQGNIIYSLARFKYPQEKQAHTILFKKFPLVDLAGKITGTMCTLQLLKRATIQQLSNLLINEDIQLDSDPVIEGLYDTHLERPVNHINKLTKREKEILREIVRGRSNSKVAETLFISPRTVETHINNMKSKWECSCRSDIIEKFFSINNLFDPLDI